MPVGEPNMFICSYVADAGAGCPGWCTRRWVIVSLWVASRSIAWDETGCNDLYQLRWGGYLIRSSSDNQDDELEDAGCPEGYRGKRLAEAGQALGITVEAIARGRDGQFVPAGVGWVVERSFA
jgi:hypothetical protein